MAKNTKGANDAAPTRAKKFWRLQGECWRRMFMPFLMYFFMGLLLLASQTIDAESTTPTEIVLGVLCIVGGMAFNAHLLYTAGVTHYDALLTGYIHRRNRIFGIVSGGDHHEETEYSPWKGFYIGFLIGLPVLILGFFTGFFYDVFALPFTIVAGWAILPLTWFGAHPEGGLIASPFLSMLFALLPVLVSGAFYIIGAMREKRRKEEEAERAERVAEVANKGKKK